MNKSKFLRASALALAVVVAFAGQAFTSPKSITYYRQAGCTGATFVPTTTCTGHLSQFCYSQNDGSGCIDLYKN